MARKCLINAHRLSQREALVDRRAVPRTPFACQSLPRQLARRGLVWAKAEKRRPPAAQLGVAKKSSKSLTLRPPCAVFTRVELSDTDGWAAHSPCAGAAQNLPWELSKRPLGAHYPTLLRGPAALLRRTGRTGSQTAAFMSTPGAPGPGMMSAAQESTGHGPTARLRCHLPAGSPGLDSSVSVSKSSLINGFPPSSEEQRVG